MEYFKGVLIMNDGAKTGTFNFNTVEEVKKTLQCILCSTTLYYKRNGIDYGSRGKLFSYEEVHGGVKSATVQKVITEPYADVTEFFVDDKAGALS